jgi:exonuclease SbcC
MKKVSDLRKFHEELNQSFYELEKVEEFPNHFYQALLAGDNTYYQKNIAEAKIFDDEWISTIESYFMSLDKITKNYKSGLKYLQEVVAIEKAKKVNSDSIKHLAANTHLIKEIRDRDVIPKRILTTQAEIDYAIYENRFIMTLIDRLFDFINRRHNIVKNNVDSIQNKFFNMKSNFELRDSIIDLEIDLKIKENLDADNVSIKNHQLLDRIHNLLKKVNGLKLSPFMEELKNAKPIIPPIMKTSIILKNVDYNNCYKLWLYLDKFNTLNFDVDVKEQNLSFDRYYMKNIYQSTLTLFTTVYGNQKALEDHYQYLDTNDYKRKSPKFIKKSLTELMTNPDPITMENTEINQFFLEQNKKILEDRLDRAIDESSSYDVALRKAIRDTIGITNALFKDYFNLDDEDIESDYFFAGIMKKDLDEELKKAKERVRIARIIRETKEVDYNNSIRLEKRLLKDIENVNKEINKGLKKRALDEAKKKAIEERIKLERLNLNKNQEILSEYLEFISAQKEMLALQTKEIQEKIKEEEKRIKLEEKKIIEAEKKKAIQVYNQEIRKAKTKQKIAKEEMLRKTKKLLKQEKKKFTDAEFKLKKESKERIKSVKEKVSTKTNVKVKAKKSEIKK